jgi:hypothetical protein
MTRETAMSTDEQVTQWIREEMSAFKNAEQGIDRDTLRRFAVDLRRQKAVIDGMLILLHHRKVIAHWPDDQAESLLRHV